MFESIAAFHSSQLTCFRYSINEICATNITVKGLIEKAEGKRAVFNKILNGLVKKYPAAIKKKEIEMP